MYCWCTDPILVSGSDVDDLIQQLVVLRNGHPVDAVLKYGTIQVPADEDGATASDHTARVSQVINPDLDLRGGEYITSND